MKVYILSVLVAGGLIAPAFGCDVCAVYSARQARGEIGSGVFAGVAEQFTHFGTMQENGREVSNPAHQWLDSSVMQVLLGYNFTERFGVQFNTPIIHRSFKRPEEGAIDRGTETGVGDVSLIGNFVAVHHETVNSAFDWRILGGVKFPTGDTHRLHEELHEVEGGMGPESGIHGHDLTLGSGSFDGIIGTSVFARYKIFFFDGGFQYAIRSEGDIGYRFADDITWAGGPGIFVVLKNSWTLALQANVSGESKAKDTFRGERADDTGLTAVYLGPQVNVSVGDHFSAQLGIDLPVSIENTALQAVPDYRVRAAMTWHF